MPRLLQSGRKSVMLNHSFSCFFIKQGKLFWVLEGHGAGLGMFLRKITFSFPNGPTDIRSFNF